MKYEKIEGTTYNLYTINTSKFKSAQIEVVFRSEATKENITYLALLGDVLMETSKDYPSRKLLTRKMYDLYNASIYVTNSRVGGMVLTDVVLNFLDPKYTSEETLRETVGMLFDMIFNPNIENGAFDEKTFNLVKARISREIEASKENPKQSSILKALQALDSSDIRSVNSCGDTAILEDITPKKLYNFYTELLESAKRDIYVIGNIDTKLISSIIEENAKFKSIPTKDYDVYLNEYKLSKSREDSSPSELSQTNLVEIYSLVGLSDFERDYVMPLFNLLWGSGSLESKLYKSLREENSLCYNVSTFYQKYDRVLIVQTAIDEESTKLALKLIKNGLDEMLKGEFEDKDLENAKNLIITSLNLTLDSPNRMIDMYVFKNLVGLEDIETRIDKFKSVKCEDLIKVAKKIKLLMTYRTVGA